MGRLCLLAVCLILAACVGPALADDVAIGTTVPEPASLLALTIGVVGLVGFAQRKRR